MEKWLLVVESNCIDPSREREFNEWYDKTHLPDVLALAGVMRASRYENPEPADRCGRFIAIYEIETVDIGAFMQALAEKMSTWIEQERLSPLIQIVSASTYRMITPPVER